jgi:hypothetical protein
MNSRRLRKEIEYHALRENTEDNVDYFLTNTTDLDFYFVLFIGSHKMYKIKMTFPSQYPFRAPKVVILDKDDKVIGDYLCSLQIINVFDEKNNRRCLCCESLVCPAKWYTTCNTIHLMNEIRKNYKTLNNNITSSCCKSIIRQKLKNNADPFLKYNIIQSFLF